MPANLEYFIYLPIMIFFFIGSMIQYKKLDKGSKILSILIGTELLTETIAFFVARKYHNNMPVYNIYSFIEIFLICTYFNYVIDIFIKTNIGIYIAIFICILGILNFTFLQPLTQLNSNFMLLEGFCIICLSLLAFFRLLLKHDHVNLIRYHHFWFISLFIFFWSTTYLLWGAYTMLVATLGNKIMKINLWIFIINMTTNIGIGSILLFYPSMQRTNE